MRPFFLATWLALVASAPLPAAAQAGTEVALDPRAWRALNVFFSNFAEAGVAPFQRGEVPRATLVRFGVLHHVFNAHERIDDSTFRGIGWGRLRASLVEAAVTRYFGVRLPHVAGTVGDFPKVAYADGYYVFPSEDYEGRPFAQVTRLREVGGGEFVADVGLYGVREVGGEDLYGTPVERLRQHYGGGFWQGRAMRARIRRAREGGRERYVLLEWLEHAPAP